jgi:ferric-dicitrate binding protein FerR (iron transport regulator)
MRKELFKQLLNKYLDGTADPAERRLVEEYYTRLAAKAAPEAKPWPYRMRVWIPAALLVLAAAGTFFWASVRREKAVTRIKEAPSWQADIAPGGNKATLTLADGRNIVLDSTRNGAITRQGSAKVMKLDDGRLAYAARAPMGSDAEPAMVAYNILSTPRGGRYKVSLSDGSNVWLNAASSVRYPTVFSGKERVVEITGEAYFEVKKDPDMPFIVKVNGAEVRVLGTDFNVMAYKDEEDWRTTLVNGAVIVREGSSTGVLKPGEQAVMRPSEGVKLAKDPDLEEALAWKNDLFSFNNADIHAVMRQLSRWYDVDISYEGNVVQHFNGDVPRAVNVSRVLKMLELTGGVHFRIEGKQIVVTP